MSGSALHSVSVSAVLVDDQDRMLATRRRDNGHWEAPGGVLEEDESIEAGLRREVREEVGVEIDIQALTGAYKNMPRRIVALVFRGSISGGIPVLSDEVADLRWLTADEVRAEMDEAYAVRVLDALRAVAPVARAHDGVHLLGPDLSGD